MALSSILYHGINESDNDADTEGDSVSDSHGEESADDGTKLKHCSLKETDEDLTKGQSSSWHAAWNLFNMVEGTGILGLPYAVKEGGLVVIFGLAILALISNYTGQILISCLYETEEEAKATDDAFSEHENNEKDQTKVEKTVTRKRVRATYEDVGSVCFPYLGGKLVITVQILELIFVSTLYLVLCGSLLVHTFPDTPVSIRGWIAIGALVVLPTVFLKELSHVAWLSLFSTLALLVTVTAVTAYGIKVSERWDIDSIKIGTMETCPVGIGIVLFSYAAHPLLPGIEQSLKNRSKFPFIMNISFLLAAVTKIIFSVTAYLAFSNKTKEVITNNLPAGAVRTVGCILLVINVLFSYAFPMFTVIQCITTSVVSKCCVPDSSRITPFLIGLRVMLVVITLLAALLIPHFALLMSFIGNLTGTCLVFVFPPLFHLKLRKSVLPWWQIILNISIILFGIAAGSVGLFSSGTALVKAYIQ
ncbi:vesicular inhibitory amino acid transporter-like [Actinia tenebrosa]|uniref:Vesicular inhibitory amino acid transporter-like n=1 Tax=Actinia tenebrosa TaxID=6105 RepID=A0A6P8J9R4_ACTTE|nr:vesicular inhibitory amino acid transporter-like [Actinia tenebrosa]